MNEIASVELKWYHPISNLQISEQLMAGFPKPLFALIQQLKKLPGVGQKTAERYAFCLMDWKMNDLKLLGYQIEQLKNQLAFCKECGCIQEHDCPFCQNQERLNGTLCIVSSPKDVFAIEQTRSFTGQYQVIPSLLNPFEDSFANQLAQIGVIERIRRLNIREVILALESTIEGDATALYLKEALHSLPQVTVSRLAYGIPLGSTLEFIDGGTLSRALMGRQPF